MKTFDVITFMLLIIGGLNWGLLGLFNFDVIVALVGDWSAVKRLVYILVGLSALYHAVAFKAIHQRWRPRAIRTT